MRPTTPMTSAIQAKIAPMTGRIPVKITMRVARIPRTMAIRFIPLLCAAASTTAGRRAAARVWLHAYRQRLCLMGP